MVAKSDMFSQYRILRLLRQQRLVCAELPIPNPASVQPGKYSS